jgi:riboflavin synthase
MFTGIVEELGAILDSRPVTTEWGSGVRLRIAANTVLQDSALGASIAVNGCCLTLVDQGVDGDQAWWDTDVSQETLDRTTTGKLSVGARVNLERPMALGDRLGGHMVLGHVDGVGKVTHFANVVDDAYGSWLLQIEAPKALAPFLAYKGSIVVNGASLTVNKTQDSNDACIVDINIIPHTLENTTLGKLKQGDTVNLEVDLIARYVARMMETQAK